MKVNVTAVVGTLALGTQKEQSKPAIQAKKLKLYAEVELSAQGYNAPTNKSSGAHYFTGSCLCSLTTK